jgi:hypothetical protein
VDIGAVLAALVAGVNGAVLQGQTLQVVATVDMPDAPEPPHFYPYTWQMAYDHDFGGGATLTLKAHLLLSKADQATGQLDATALSSVGADTIRDVVQSLRHNAAGGRGLGGACADLRLTEAAGPRDFAFPDSAHFWGVEFTLFVID